MAAQSNRRAMPQTSNSSRAILHSESGPTSGVCVDSPGRLDPNVAIEETVGAIADLVRAGYVRTIGLVGGGTGHHPSRAVGRPISDLQIEYSLVSRSPETRIFPLLAELGIGVRLTACCRAACSVVRSRPRRVIFGRICRASPARIASGNQLLIEALEKLASEKGVTVSQLAIAWVLAKGDDIVRLIGARKREQLAESRGALQIELTAADVARLEEAVPPSAVAPARATTNTKRGF